MWKQKYKNRNKGFTLIELLVTIGIIATLAGIGAVTVSKVRTANQQTTCVNNLRAISQGLQLYYDDRRVFPEDGYPDDTNDLLPLSTELAGYISTKPTFVCPEDKDTTSTGNFASYDQYYVARKGSYDTEELAIGCPRHRGAKNSTSTFSTGSTEITRVGTVLANGQEIPPDGTTTQRKISNVNDTMTFDDGSIVKINASGGSYGCILIQSVQLADGTLYSIVKVQDNGIIDVTVTSGSKFEVVTPSAIVGVRGTQFTVQTSDSGSSPGYKTDVTLTTGTVILMDRKTGKTTLLATGGTTVASVDIPMHTHWHNHEDGTYHSHEHPAQNYAHHGKYVPVPISADDAALLAAIDDPLVNSSAMRHALLAASPISDTVLNAAISRSNPMNSSHLEKVLVNEAPLATSVLQGVVDRNPSMNSSHNRDVFIASSPLPTSILDQITAGNPPMNPGHLQDVLDVQ